MTEASVPMQDPVRIGIVGTEHFHFPAYANLIDELREAGRATVELVSGGPPRKSPDLHTRWPEVSVAGGWTEVAHSDSVDLVLVLTASQQHAEVARVSLEAGKHVLVEKPMATTLSDGAALLATARDASGWLICAPHVTLSPVYSRIRTHIQRGDLGSVLLARGFYGESLEGVLPRWFYEPGSGAILDLAVYTITSITGLLGPVERVTSFAGTAVSRRLTDRDSFVDSKVNDNGHVLLDFGHAVNAVVSTGLSVQKYDCSSLELYGTEGTIELIGDDWDPKGYKLWTSEDGWETHRTDPWDWVAGLAYLVDCIRTARRPAPSVNHAYHVLEIMIASQEAAIDGSARKVASTFEDQAAVFGVETSSV